MIQNQSLFSLDTNLSLDSKNNGDISASANHQTQPLSSVNSTSDASVLYPIEWVIPITVVYGIIFIFGLVGNVSTCIVIARNKSLHTVTNYYLFSIAISDLLLLISGLPPEMYRIWSPETYVFGEAFCILQGFAAETSANATVLTITAFTVERYLAICHPFLSHTMSNLSRAIKYILAIWICALCLAAPQAIQFGVEYQTNNNGIEESRCTVVANDFFQHAFEISTFMIFVGPMTLITGLYILIAIKLNKSKMMRNNKRASLASTAACHANIDGVSRASRKVKAQNRVIKMLVAVVVAFFICWAPFHAQRLLAVYLSAASPEAQAMCIDIYIALMYISGVLYFLSTTVNPILYHIMSNKFRQAFKNTFYGLCNRGTKDKRQRTYSVLSRCPPSLRNYQRSISDGVQTCHATVANGDEQMYMMELANHNNHTSINHNNINNPQKVLEKNVSDLSRQRPHSQSRSSDTTILTTISNVLPLEKHNKHNLKTTTLKENKDNQRCFVRFFKLFNNNHQGQKTETNRYSKNSQKNQNGGKIEKTDDISNSSLQDFGEELEYSSTDLMKYMEEVNVDLTTNT